MSGVWDALGEGMIRGSENFVAGQRWQKEQAYKQKLDELAQQRMQVGDSQWKINQIREQTNADRTYNLQKQQIDADILNAKTVTERQAALDKRNILESDRAFDLQKRQAEFQMNQKGQVERPAITNPNGSINDARLLSVLQDISGGYLGTKDLYGVFSGKDEEIKNKLYSYLTNYINAAYGKDIPGINDYLTNYITTRFKYTPTQIKQPQAINPVTAGAKVAGTGLIPGVVPAAIGALPLATGLAGSLIAPAALAYGGYAGSEILQGRKPASPGALIQSGVSVAKNFFTPPSLNDYEQRKAKNGSIVWVNKQTLAVADPETSRKLDLLLAKSRG